MAWRALQHTTLQHAGAGVPHAGASPSLRSFLAKHLVAAGAQPEGKDPSLLAVLARLADHRLPVADLPVCKNEDSLFPAGIHRLRLLERCSDIGAAMVSAEPRDLSQGLVLRRLVVRYVPGLSAR